MKKKLTILVLLFVLLIQFLPVAAFAETEECAEQCQYGSTGWVSNPLYPGLESEKTAPRLRAGAQFVAPVGAVSWSMDDLGIEIAKKMETRADTFSVQYKSYSEISESQVWQIWDKAFVEYDVPTRGDYIKWHWKYVWVNWRWSKSDGVYTTTLSFEVDYHTTYSQETALTEEVNKIIDSFGFTASTSDYEKAYTIYEWVTANITYDYDGLDDLYSMAHTAYNGIMYGTCVCQGYASIIYRMYLQVGIPVRTIGGDAYDVYPYIDPDETGDNHCWNIAQIDGKWYNLDSTWDADYAPAYWDWFLKCPANFPDHSRWVEYDTNSFHEQYPMGTSDYTYDPGLIGNSGTCGENLTWTLDEEGVLTISGTGVMYDYYYNAPWYDSRDMIKAVVIENGVTGIGECAFATCANLVNVTIADSVTSIGAAAFNNCDSIMEITIPNSVTTIGNAAFCASDGLVNMVIPDSVTHIDGSLFNNCIGLRSVVIGDGLVEIPGHDFAFCENLEEVTIGESVASIGGSTFTGCSSLSRIVFRGDVPVFESENVFRGVSATAYYPVGNATWTEDVMQDYGGNITWLVDCKHSYDAVVTAPTCIDTGHTNYTCVFCGGSYIEEIPATGHSYENGSCIVCGGADPDYVPESEWFDFRGSSMTLGNTLEINFAVAVADITGENNYIVVSKEYADGTVVSKTYPQAEWTAQGTSVSYVSFRVTAKEMNDKLTVIAYNENDQQISEAYVDSVAGYCLRKLRDEDKRPVPRAKYRALYVDMLNYGAAAQQKWEYNTENLANATLTEIQKGYATKITQKDNILQKGEGYKGTSLSLKDNILMNIAFYTSALTEVEYAVVNFISHNNVDKTVLVPIEDFITQGSIKYISLECMAVADYAQPVTIDLYNAADELISATMDSMGSYAGRQTKDVYLYEAILAFGMGAYNYFHS